MDALVNFGPRDGEVELRRIPEPEPGPDDVLLRVRAAGVCGSDLHQFRGHASWPVEHPVVLGHEFCGEIVERGDAVECFSIGDRVVSETAAWLDPRSPYVLRGEYNIDPSRRGFGTRVDGAMATYVRVPERCLHQVPDSLPDVIAGITEPGCVAYTATCVQTRIRPADQVAIIGPGPIGLLCAWLARRSGALGVAVLGRSGDERRLELARHLGATSVIADGTVEQARACSPSGEFDVVIDAAGHSATLLTALAIVRAGGQITKVGWGPQPLDASLDPLVGKAVTLQGSFSHTWETWERVLSLYESEPETISPLVGWTGILRDWRDGFEAAAAGAIAKAVILAEGPQ